MGMVPESHVDELRLGEQVSDGRPGVLAGLPEERLPRRLGAISAVGVLVGIVIGSGIFRVPSLVVADVGSAGAAALVWVLGAVVSLCGALTLAELAVAYPRSGGAYVFLRDAYGPSVAFLFGWIKLLVTGPAAVAAISLIFAAYAGAFVPLTDGQQRVVAAALILGLATTNILSVRWTASVQNLSTLAKVVALGALALLLMAFGTRAEGALAGPIAWSPTSWGGFGVALMVVLWTYTGWVDLTYIAGEVKDPVRTYPRAMVAGLGIVVVVYLLANAAYLFVLDLAEVAQSSTVAATAAEHVFAAGGRDAVAALVMVAAFGSLNGTLLTTPRVFFSMAQDGLFFRSIGAVHQRYQTPYVAILLYSVLGIVGVLTRTFEQLAQIFVLGIWPFYTLAVGAVFIIRRRHTATASLYLTWGYPFVPIIFVAVSVLMLLNGLVEKPGNTAISVGILLLGLPVYFGWRRLPPLSVPREGPFP